jgi:hypothetical protein
MLYRDGCESGPSFIYPRILTGIRFQWQLATEKWGYKLGPAFGKWIRAMVSSKAVLGSERGVLGARSNAD